MKRRNFLFAMFALATTPLIPLHSNGTEAKLDNMPKIKKLVLSETEWQKRLTAAQFDILREEDTEPPRSSPLNDEKRKGIYACAGCDLPLFKSEMKFDSDTGWPSFFDSLANAVETRTDFKLFFPRTEYHCARCGGHQGHVFDDGPQPTGLRFCNNGLALKFIPTRS